MKTSKAGIDQIGQLRHHLGISWPDMAELCEMTLEELATLHWHEQGLPIHIYRRLCMIAVTEGLGHPNDAEGCTIC